MQPLSGFDCTRHFSANSKNEVGSGSNHDAADLSKILTGRMLDEWKDRAANLQADGWYGLAQYCHYCHC